MRSVNGVVRALDASIAGATAVASWLGSVLVMALTLLVCADVIGRNLLGAPVPGVPELVALSIVPIVFLHAPRALAQGRLARSDGLLRSLRSRWPLFGPLIDGANELAGAVVFGLLTVGTWPLLVAAWQHDEFVGAIGELTVPVWPVRLTVVLGSSLLCVNFVVRAFALRTTGRR